MLSRGAGLDPSALATVRDAVDKVRAAAESMYIIFTSKYTVTDSSSAAEKAFAKAINKVLGTEAGRERFTSFEAVGKLLDNAFMVSIERKIDHALKETLEEMLKCLAERSLGIEVSHFEATAFKKVYMDAKDSTQEKAVQGRAKSLCPKYAEFRKSAIATFEVERS